MRSAVRRPQEAIAQYRLALQLSPNRLNALLSAAAAAEQAGLSADAHNYYVLVAKQTGTELQLGEWMLRTQ